MCICFQLSTVAVLNMSCFRTQEPTQFLEGKVWEKVISWGSGSITVWEFWKRSEVADLLEFVPILAPLFPSRLRVSCSVFHRDKCTELPSQFCQSDTVIRPWPMRWAIELFCLTRANWDLKMDRLLKSTELVRRIISFYVPRLRWGIMIHAHILVWALDNNCCFGCNA